MACHCPATGSNVLVRPSRRLQVRVRLTVESIKEPSWLRVGYMILEPLAADFRAFFLYNRMPYDRAIWSKLRDPWTAIFMYIAASPTVWVRGGFFTIYLLCILPEREEFQVRRCVELLVVKGPSPVRYLRLSPRDIMTEQVTKFILGLKGTQFLSGIFKLVTLCLSFWQCSVTILDGDGCRMQGPGVDKPALNDLMMIVWLQALLWLGFLLLPYSGEFDKSTGVVSFRRAHLLWARAKLEGLSPTQVREPKQESESESESPSKVDAMKRRGSTLGSSCQLFGGKKTPRRPKEVVSNLVSSTSAVSSSILAGAASSVTSTISSGYQRLGGRQETLESLAEESSVRSLSSWRSGWDRWVQWATKWAARARSNSMAATYPMRTGATKNRLFTLLTWDSRSFIVAVVRL